MDENRVLLEQMRNTTTKKPKVWPCSEEDLDFVKALYQCMYHLTALLKSELCAHLLPKLVVALPLHLKIWFTTHKKRSASNLTSPANW